MSVIFLLIPLSVVIAACFLGAFIWAVRSGQYEDTCTPSWRLLLRDAPPKSRARREELRNRTAVPDVTHASLAKPGEERPAKRP
jgi:cbb3-type cytochrome oxidase maturation protein